MYSPGDKVIVTVHGVLPSTTLGNTYTVVSTWTQQNKKVYTYVGDDMRMYDVEETTFNPAVVKLFVPQATTAPTQTWKRVGDWMHMDFSGAYAGYGLECRCGAKAVGVSDKDTHRHSSWCDIVTGKNSG